MSGTYSVLITEGFVVNTFHTGEADMVISFLTKNRGIIDVYARSIRKEVSKMSCNVSKYNKVSVSIILGKNNILKDIVVSDTLESIWSDKEKSKSFASLIESISDFIPGLEIEDGKVFSIVESALSSLEKCDSKDSEKILLVARVLILDALGYVNDDEMSSSMFNDILKNISGCEKKELELRRHLENALFHIT